MDTSKYRLMIYFAHSTMMLYDLNVISNKDMSVEDFMQQNKVLMTRVFQEGLNIFNYELSNLQLSKASYCYLRSKYYPQDVLTTQAYQLKEPC